MANKNKIPAAPAPMTEGTPAALGTGVSNATRAAHRTKPKVGRKTPRASAGAPGMSTLNMNVGHTAQLTKLILENQVAGLSKPQYQERFLTQVRSIFASI